MSGFSFQQQGLPPDGGCGMCQDLRTSWDQAANVTVASWSSCPSCQPGLVPVSLPGASTQVALGIWAEPVWPHSGHPGAQAGTQVGQCAGDVPAGVTHPKDHGGNLLPFLTVPSPGNLPMVIVASGTGDRRGQTAQRLFPPRGGALGSLIS